MKKLAALACAMVAAAPLTAQTYTFSNGNAVQAASLTGFSTVASQMAGMTVKGLFSNGATFEGVWANLGGTTWGVNINNWFRVTMEEGATTFTAPWTVRGQSEGFGLTSVQFNGAPGRTLFDTALPDRTGPCESNSEFGTPGSADGCAVKTLAGGTYAGSVRADFTNIFSLTGNAPVGDMFEQLTVNFTSGGGLLINQTYVFRQDTDNSPSNQPPPQNVVPEPSTYLLMATGFLGLAAIRRRRSMRS